MSACRTHLCVMRMQTAPTLKEVSSVAASMDTLGMGHTARVNECLPLLVVSYSGLYILRTYVSSISHA